MTMAYLFTIGSTTVEGVSGTVTQLYANVGGMPLRVNMVPA